MQLSCLLGGESGVFPLVFTSTGLTSPSLNYDSDAPLLYSLKHGPHGLPATSLSTPNILAVQIPSTNQTTLNIKNAYSNTEVTLDSHVQVKSICVLFHMFFLLLFYLFYFICYRDSKKNVWQTLKGGFVLHPHQYFFLECLWS